MNSPQKNEQFVLLGSVFVVASCGLVYELIASTLASYLLGDSVTQFSTVIGTYLFAMGVGSWLSRYVERDLVAVFVRVELIIGVVGGTSAALLFVLFDHVGEFRVLLYGLVGIIGILVGLEIPLLMRILSDELDLRDLVSKVFTFDYVGALVASIAFPLVLVPRLGLVRSAFLFGMLNALVAMVTLHLLRAHLRRVGLQMAIAAVVLVGLTAGFVMSEKLVRFAENSHFPGTVVHAQSTPYQRIVLTQAPGSSRLYLNGNLQFDSRDEHRYHESLVHPAFPGPHVRDVLILGGGDGMAAREILKYDGIAKVTLVDLDPAVTHVFSTRTELRTLNKGSLSHEKVRVINEDAFAWVRNTTEQFDYVVIDLPDPSNYSVGKLFTDRFYREIKRILRPQGAVVVQSTSPFVAPKAFWCVDATMRAAGLMTAPFHAQVPSFGIWGFVAGFHPSRTFAVNPALPTGLRYVSAQTLAGMFVFPTDMDRLTTDINRLDNQALVHYYEAEWGAYAASF